MERVLVGVLCASLCALCARAAATVIHVDPAGADTPGGGSAESPLRTIQYALDAAADDDTVMVHPGTYTGPGNYGLTPRGKNVHIRSVDPADATVVGATIINPAAAGRGFAFVDGESAACILDGLTIMGGRAAGHGGAIYCFYSSPTILRCILASNSATVHGGAVYLYHSDASLRQSAIMNNTASSDGGGIESWYGNFTMANCLVCGNVAGGQGGGVDIVNSPQARVVNCTVADNHAGAAGGGIYLWNSTGNVTNSIVWNNTANGNSQIGLNLASTIVVGYSDVQGGYAGHGNINDDPLFVGLSGSQTAYYDYHVLSEWGRYDVVSGLWVHDAATSPCIDAGDPAVDYTAEPWPHGGRVNIGAFGATAQASMNGNPADFNIDGMVDWRDLAELADHWLEQAAGIYNLDGTGRVDMKDAAIFLQHWRWRR